MDDAFDLHTSIDPFGLRRLGSVLRPQQIGEVLLIQIRGERSVGKRAVQPGDRPAIL